MKSAAHHNPLLAKGLKLSHLRIIAAFAETGHLGQAAAMLGITQPAASRLLAEIERICGHPVHGKSGRGAQLSEVGLALAQRAERILMELQDTSRELDGLGKGKRGQVAIGAVTAPALDLILPALREARFSYPDVQIDVTVTASDVLFDQLINGKLDFVLGRIPSTADADLVTWQSVGKEPLKLVARSGHPLTAREQITLTDVMQFDWIMPARGSPMTEAILARLDELGSNWPMQRMTTSSFLLTLALLQQSNSIAPLSSAVAAQFAMQENAALTTLNIDIGCSVDVFGILTRRHAVQPLAARNVLAIIQRAIGMG